MSEEAGAPAAPETGATPPPYPQQPYAGQPYYYPDYAAYAPSGPEPTASKSSKAWLWLVIGLIFFACVIGSVLWAASLMSGEMSAVNPMGGTVAIIPMSGTIQGTGNTFDGIVTPGDFVSKLEQAEDDPFVKAIVLRIDSPGGTVAASEEIAAEVAECPKPVVASIGDVGASGAYMVASQTDSIVAMDGSSVGSIGVIMSIPNVEGLLDKVGVKITTLTSGEFKDAGSPFRELTDEEKQRLQGQLDEVYGQFIDIVAEGRELPRSEVESLATGWVWTGTEAKELGLVDEIGTMNDAIAVAAKLGKIEGEPNIVNYEQPRFEGLLGSLFGLSSRLDQLGALLEGVQPAREGLPR